MVGCDGRRLEKAWGTAINNDDMNCSPNDYVPHCSPVDSIPNTMTPDVRSMSGAILCPKTGPGRPQSQVSQAHLSSTQPLPASQNSVPQALTQVPHPSYQQSLPPSNPSAIPPNGATHAMFRVQMWSNNFDSGVHSMNQSSAPSLLSVSSLRAGSQISTISDEGHSRIELNDQQQMKFENIPSNLGRGSQEGETRTAIPDVIHLLSDADEVVVQRAATMLQNIAKLDSEKPPYAEPYLRPPEVILPLRELLRTQAGNPAIIKASLGALFQISTRRDGLESTLRINDQTKGGLLVDIIRHINFTGGSAIRYAILTFHTIIAEKTANGRNIEIARANNALQAVTQFLDRESNEKLLSVIVECVRLLCDKSQTQRALFMQLNGPSKLFHILRTLRYEGLLWRTTQLLKILSNADPQAIVNCGGYDVLHVQLEHASQRLVISTLECIRNMSDVPTKDMDVSALLNKLLQLLGAMDPLVVLYCTGILSNLLANNQNNKNFLFNRGGIPILYRVLLNTYNIPATTPNQQQRVEDIQERGLATLRHLCVGHTHQAEAQKAVLQQEFAADFLLRKLTEMRPSILKQTLQILNKSALQDSNLALFRELRLRISPDCETSFVERILLILKVACEQLPSTQMVEEVRVADLIQLSLSTLQLLCRDQHLLNQVAYFVRRPDFLMYRDNECPILLPIFCLYQGYVEDENLRRSALGLISELAAHPEIAPTYAGDSGLMNVFQHYMRSRNQAFATYAQLAYERATHNGNPGLMYSSYPPPNSHRLMVQPGSVGHAGQPYGGGAIYEQQQPQQAQYYQNYSVGQVNHYGGNGASQYLPQQTVMSASAPPLYSDHESTSNIQSQSIPQQHPHQPGVYGREGPSQATNLSNSMDCSSSEPWPEDLSGLSISDDPFATMITQQFNSPQSRQHLRPVYPTGSMGRAHAAALNICCGSGPPSSICDQPMESVHMGSPEAPASWSDPTFGNIPM